MVTPRTIITLMSQYKILIAKVVFTNLPESSVGFFVSEPECQDIVLEVEVYRAPSGTKIKSIYDLPCEYLNHVTWNRIWQTCLQIALWELVFWKHISKSRYNNLHLEKHLRIALRELVFAKYVFKLRYWKCKSCY